MHLCNIFIDNPNFYISLTDAEATQIPDNDVEQPQLCDPEQRINRIKRWCKIQENVNRKPFPTVDSLDDQELKKVVKNRSWMINTKFSTAILLKLGKLVICFLGTDKHSLVGIKFA